MSDKQNARILRQLDEIAELRRDKERLDWLDQKPDIMHWKNKLGGHSMVMDDDPKSLVHGSSIRAAIDAAIKEEADASK
jgi:hypothetical protein